ncbi:MULTISPECIES: cupin-like domain-containing protein [Calothrix]|uniref:Cupin-like domain-containing protein n=2 Tax=Calothrix TaxID=1186 RepID=A0ABR8A711_9CYAN|nr:MULTISPECIES: cupin-like domain-containing protein [Calothrix]MBD2195792.1 cupin-like domain-containing protein [Calothrix parietina FACHB-288]MBD2224448.1 cupin-like domain-containing protein [Calothrix anomala FACHB-343]
MESLEVLNLETKEVPRISRTAFLELTPATIMKFDRPIVVDFLEPPEPGTITNLIRSEIGDLPAALFKKSRDPEAPGRSQVTKIPLNSFFKTPLYSSSSHKTIYRIVTNIKYQTELIDRIIGMKANQLFPYQQRGNSANLWINYEGQFGRAHFDELENFNLQLEGTKRFVCLPPGRSNFYIRSFWRGFGHHSQAVNFDAVDEARFPKLMKELSARREIILRPGQLLYIPLGWWHQVEPLGEININLNFWLHSWKALRRPYVFIDGVYKVVLRQLLGLYDYQPEQRHQVPTFKTTLEGNTNDREAQS